MHHAAELPVLEVQAPPGMLIALGRRLRRHGSNSAIQLFTRLLVNSDGAHDEANAQHFHW